MQFLKKYEELITENKYTELTISNIESKYKYFHLSKIRLLNSDKKTFTFSPRIPFDTYLDIDGHIIEDNFTPRISLAPTIKYCLHAIENSRPTNLYIYGTNKSNFIELNKTCPIGYDDNFTLKGWLDKLPISSYEEIQLLIHNDNIKQEIYKPDEIDYKEIYIEDFITAPNDLPDKYKNMFYACVPDAYFTQEVWALSNLKMEYLGEIDYIDVDAILYNNEDVILRK